MLTDALEVCPLPESFLYHFISRFIDPRPHKLMRLCAAYQASPVHVELILEENAALVPKAAETAEPFVLE